MTTPNSFKIRQAVPSDHGLILKTWMREMREATPKAYPDRHFYNDWQKKILALTRKAGARVICTANDPSYICGFVVAVVYPDIETTVVWFCHMRGPFRRLGLMKAALEDMGHQEGYEIVAPDWHPYLDRFNLKKLNLLHNPSITWDREFK